MKSWKWAVFALSGGLLLSMSTCMTSVADTVETYLPDLLDTLLANAVSS